MRVKLQPIIGDKESTKLNSTFYWDVDTGLSDISVLFDDIAMVPCSIFKRFISVIGLVSQPRFEGVMQFFTSKYIHVGIAN